MRVRHILHPARLPALQRPAAVLSRCRASLQRLPRAASQPLLPKLAKAALQAQEVRGRGLLLPELRREEAVILQLHATAARPSRCRAARRRPTRPLLALNSDMSRAAIGEGGCAEGRVFLAFLNSPLVPVVVVNVSIPQCVQIANASVRSTRGAYSSNAALNPPVTPRSTERALNLITTHHYRV